MWSGSESARGHGRVRVNSGLVDQSWSSIKQSVPETLMRALWYSGTTCTRGGSARTTPDLQKRMVLLASAWADE